MVLIPNESHTSKKCSRLLRKYLDRPSKWYLNRVAYTFNIGSNSSVDPYIYYIWFDKSGGLLLAILAQPKHPWCLSKSFKVAIAIKIQMGQTKSENVPSHFTLILAYFEYICFSFPLQISLYANQMLPQKIPRCWLL